jgi:hypothetical protein
MYWDKMWARDFSGYSDPGLTGPYELAADSEVVQNFNANVGNAQAHNYFRIDSRMRQGSHHLASWFNSSPAADGWQPLSDMTLGGVGTSTTFYDVQREFSDRPSAIDIATEDQGLGLPFVANASIGLQLHHINAGSRPILRELWINVWWLPDGESITPVQFSPIGAPINYPPNQVIDNTASATATGDTRVISIFGHRHAWTTRFSAQVIRATGETQDAYESFNWLEMPTYDLESASTNPAPDPAIGVDGAMSGDLILHAGDRISFTCHVDTTAAAAAKLGVAVPSSNLREANEAFGAEMCILNLETAGPSLTAQFGQ